MFRQLLLVFAVVAVAILLYGTARALQASPASRGGAAADAAIPCSKAAVAKIVHVAPNQSISAVRCADVNSDGRHDVAWSKSGGGSYGDMWWGIVYEHEGRRKVARFSGYSRYNNLRIRGQRMLIDSPIYRPGNPNCCPTGGIRTESATWDGDAFAFAVAEVQPGRADTVAISVPGQSKQIEATFPPAGDAGARHDPLTGRLIPEGPPGVADTRHDSINQELIRLIRSVPAGGWIRGGIYRINHPGVLAALDDAKIKRFVTIELVQDIKDKIDLRGRLGLSAVRRCARSPRKSACNASARRGEMHSKYFLFSAATTAADPNGPPLPNVTWIGSHNAVSGPGGAASSNNSVTVYDDADLLTQMHDRVWHYMWNWATPSLDGPPWGNDFLAPHASPPRGYAVSTKSNVAVLASPDAEGDIVAETLKQANPNADCHVRVMHNMLRRRNRQPDGTYDDVVKQLVRLRKGGCSVNVLVSFNPGSNRARIQDTARDALQRAGIPVKTKMALHDKAILVKARWGNEDAVSYHVLTGSHNITIDALRNNDELLLLLGHNQTAHDAFVQHFAEAWDSAGNDFLCLGSSRRLASSTNCATTG